MEKFIKRFFRAPADSFFIKALLLEKVESQKNKIRMSGFGCQERNIELTTIPWNLKPANFF